MKARAAARESASELAEAGVPEPAFEAELLARHAGGLSRAQYYAGADLSPGRVDRFRDAVRRRTRREPAAYITGVREFYGREFAVGPGVLIPRPETELLVELGLAELRQAPESRLADVGTGTGCVAIPIAASFPGARIVGTDLSGAALAFARLNRELAGVAIDLVRGDLLDSVAAVDVVLANLPYVPAGDVDALEPELREWEPRVALDGGPDGLSVLRRCIWDCGERLRPRLLALEVAYGQAAAVAEECMRAGAQVEVLRDLAGIDRVVCGRWR
jgi:release factor glutamine methyltransferase